MRDEEGWHWSLSAGRGVSLRAVVKGRERGEWGTGNGGQWRAVPLRPWNQRGDVTLSRRAEPQNVKNIFSRFVRVRARSERVVSALASRSTLDSERGANVVPSPPTPLPTRASRARGGPRVVPVRSLFRLVGVAGGWPIFHLLPVNSALGRSGSDRGARRFENRGGAGRRAARDRGRWTRAI